MLDVLRKRKRSWVILLVVGVIVIVFVLFYGAGPGMNEPRLEPVAQVNGEIITQREFDVHHQRLVAYYRDLFKGNLTEETLRSLNLGSAVIDELIKKRLLLQEARKLGLEVTDGELMESIAAIPGFQVEGRFSKLRYQELLRANRLTASQFEADHRELLIMERLTDTIQDSVHVTEAEVWDEYRLSQQKINLYFVHLPAGDFANQVEVTETEIKDRYDQSKETFKEPLSVQVEYLAYPFSHFSSQVQIGDEEIKNYYEIHRDTKFRQPQALRLRHILFRVPEGTVSQERDATRSKAEEVLRRARSGADFTELARENSQDPSAAQGGDIGFFSAGQMLPELDKAAFALKKGEISGVIETALGYHILKIEDVRDEKTKSLDEARQEIIGILRSERQRSEAAKAGDSDRDKLVSGSTTLESLAGARGLNVKVSPFFSQSEVLPEVGRVDEFYQRAFSLAVREISPLIEGPTAYYLLRVKERKEPSIPSLDHVRRRIEEKLKEEKALGLAMQKANTLLERLKQERNLRRLAREHDLKVQETGWFVRGATEIPKIGSLDGVDSGGIAVSSQKPIPEQIYVQAANVYLLAFKESEDADRDKFEKEKERLLDQALTEKRQKVLQRFVDHLKANARIEVQPLFL